MSDGKKASRSVTEEEMFTEIGTHIAVWRYKHFGLTDGLEAMGLDRETIRRPAHRPKKPIYTPTGEFITPTARNIVHLVLKQKWQAGLGFSNSNGGEQNPCIVKVSENTSLNVRDVRLMFEKGVSATERKRIERWLVQYLMRHGQIHPKKIRKAKKLLGG